MKKYGKIIIAFMWLGLTMIMIVGATFAWFAENRNVSADGMHVQAETASNLLIRNSDTQTEFDYSADATNSATTTLSPASTSNTVATGLKAGAFFFADRANIEYDSGAATDDTIFSSVVAANIATDDAVSSGKTYVSKNTFYITAVGDATKKFENVYISAVTATVSDAAASQNISKALRVGVVCTNGETTYGYIFAPVTGYSASYKGIKAAGTGLTSTTLAADNETITTVGTSATLGELKLGATAGASSNTLTVYVYVWYEGQDASCTSANSVNVEELLVKVSFQCSGDPVAQQ
ncbi:MAG: hypothetical protein J6W25_05080 [Bacilli bacterium]|nr:hypothetical protein [Bacilli bacterium]MBO7535835.1 hypothetical protein [Bacilli bacterium]MBP5550431.1 hypothetical protein [Bacilli bacterium]